MTRRRYLALAEFKRLVAAGEEPGDVILRKAYTADVEKDAGEGRPIYNFTVSTESVDRDADTIAIDGWQLANYKRNPVVMWAHDYKEPPLGQASKVKAADGKLLSSVRFDSDISEFAKMIEAMVDRGTLRSASVGFRPMEHSFNDVRRGTDFTKQELLEWSIVPIPANPEALMEARSAGLDLAPLRGWAERVLEDQLFRAAVAPGYPREVIEAAWRAGKAGHAIVILGAPGAPTSQNPRIGEPIECPLTATGACQNPNQAEDCKNETCPIAGAADGGADGGRQPGDPGTQPRPSALAVPDPAIKVVEAEAIDDGELVMALRDYVEEHAFDGLTSADIAAAFGEAVPAALGELIPAAVQAAINRHTGRVD